MYKKLSIVSFAVLLVAGALFGNNILTNNVQADDESEHDLTVMATTEIHAHLMPYDYYRDMPDESIGLVKTYSLVKDIRENYGNTMLFDTGDIFQGAILGEFVATIEPLEENETNPIIAAMNLMDYDAVNIGNHEFDFGLDFMHRSFQDAEFPIINANVYAVDEDGNATENYFDPYVILEQEVDDKTVNVGVLGLTPPGIMTWHADKLPGEVTTKPVIDTIEKFLPQMKEDGADLIFINIHGGKRLEDGADAEINDEGEHSLYFFAEQFQDEIDAILFGHEQSVFPGDSKYDGVDGIDNENGLIHGIPSVMAGFAGDHLGVVDLKLSHSNGNWEVIEGSARNIPVEEDTEAAPELVEVVQDRHDQTIEYVRSSIGVTEVPINHFFSRVMDTTATDLINRAQIWKAEELLEHTEYNELPIIASAAPFRAGRTTPNEYTDISEGAVSVNDIADLYMYPNIFYVVKLDGEQIIDVLEHSALNFNQIDPESSEEQELVSGIEPFNFDVIKGIEYEIDVTQPEGSRIVNATFEGEPLSSDMEFALVTNNYRANGGGDFPHLDGSNTILRTDDTNREALIEYVTQIGTITDSEPNWAIKPVETAGPVIFKSSPSGAEYIGTHDLTTVTYVEERDGWGVYSYNFENILAAGEEEATEAEEAEESTEEEISSETDVAEDEDESNSALPIVLFLIAAVAVVGFIVMNKKKSAAK
ncbi:bifunctional 2',3'-cyclic-nucleotide 2'-phosphodiesterase/3'-nucleotidase [Bacillus shivajii]|uniref:bifunctional 2',3'-cyclic-nucleotide 2'-phosphodiesterase/3'-nucleotidase n=1 Tax=Bacillus shivajii TaxID=1983719 RepID=UPI001CFBB48F|nr:bifunctional 2',3'-cyclic-nucleotide 2'-phosphodiesterase/3'-nucleotidase [Bacillus shivajii]UCZ54082.1 bifunctional 2',3'-cyclic-nucleotide 2'-phosphodiesterase/3'-nucleotidase [Bacillus shivajii]